MDATRYAISLVLFMAVTVVMVVSAALALRRRGRQEMKAIPIHSAQYPPQHPNQHTEER